MSVKVSLAYVHDIELATSFVDSLMGLAMYDAATGGYLAHDDGKIAVRYGTDGLVSARNMAVTHFLASDSEWLLWIDTDMGFEPDTLERLLYYADPTDRPIVGGLCFASREVASDGMGGYDVAPRPTLFEWVQHPDGQSRFTGVADFPVNTLVKVDGTGSALILIHRSVFEKIGEGDWYTRVKGSDGSLLGEDISMCVRAAAVGCPIYVHTGVRTTHQKPYWLGEPQWWRYFTPPPATDAVDVIVPVMQRPQNAAPFMRSLRASTGLARVWAVTDRSDTDTRAAWRTAGARVLTINTDSPGTFAQKVNHAVNAGKAPWVFIVGDDVQFRPGWLDHAEHVGNRWHAKVIGTNDLGSPRVQAGHHATHILLSREYIREHGASWGQPGAIAHDGYSHWYVDDEIVTAAKQRGVWGMALGSIVEHLHPLFGKGAPDAVYERGSANREADAALFEARAQQFLS